MEDTAENEETTENEATAENEETAEEASGYSGNVSVIEEYKEIIETQRSMIEANNKRIDELTNQIGVLINNGGMYREDPKREYKRVDFGIENLSESLEEMDFSM